MSSWWKIVWQSLKKLDVGWVLWGTHVIPATLEAEIGRIAVPGQLKHRVSETPFQSIS
jgi:hypothetical protein